MMSILIFMLLTTILTLADIGIKSYVESHVKEGEEIDILDKRVKVRKFYNKGLPFGKLADKEDLVKKLSLFATIFVTLQFLFTLLRKGHGVKKLGLALLTAGAVGNTFDRLLRGYVVDYLSVNVKSEKINRITFNLADLLILVGTLKIIFAGLLPNKKSGKGAAK